MTLPQEGQVVIGSLLACGIGSDSLGDSGRTKEIGSLFLGCVKESKEETYVSFFGFGWDVVLVSSIRVPQAVQKDCPGLIGLPQEGQTFSFVATLFCLSMRVPQAMQKESPGLTNRPQLGQLSDEEFSFAGELDCTCTALIGQPQKMQNCCPSLFAELHFGQMIFAFLFVLPMTKLPKACPLSFPCSKLERILFKNPFSDDWSEGKR